MELSNKIVSIQAVGIAGLSLLVLKSLVSAYHYYCNKRLQKKFEGFHAISINQGNSNTAVVNNMLGLIRNTPIVYSKYLSQATGHNVYIKLENMLPYTSKDRMILHILTQAILRKELKPDSILYEGSSGSTCYSVAMIGNILGLKCRLVIPDDLSEEKLNLLKSTGAELIITKQCPFSNFNDNYVRLAKKLAGNDPKGFFVNQFENEDNSDIHFISTGPEIIKQLGSVGIKLDAVICGAGTGGTISGLSRYFKKINKNIKIILSDVTGSGLYSYVKNNVVFTEEESEATRTKYRYYTCIEGVGVNFLTNNFKKAIIDDAIKVTDEEAISAAKKVYESDGIFAGGSSGVNFAAVIKYASQMPKGSNVLTIMYDSGLKYLKKLYTNKEQDKPKENKDINKHE